jgi:hypothetical protein
MYLLLSDCSLRLRKEKTMSNPERAYRYLYLRLDDNKDMWTWALPSFRKSGPLPLGVINPV